MPRLEPSTNPYSRKHYPPPIHWEGTNLLTCMFLLYWNMLTDYRFCRCPLCRRRLTKSHTVTEYGCFDLFHFTCPNCDYRFTGMLDLQ